MVIYECDMCNQKIWLDLLPEQPIICIWCGGVYRTSSEARKPETKPSNPKDAVGVKKTPFSVIPLAVIGRIALALLEGARKYGRHNYRAAGVRASVYFDAATGHLFDWWEGQDIDPESQLCHIDKALASLVVLRDAMLQDMWEDDRPPRSKVLPRQGNNAAASDIIERVRPNDPEAPWTQKRIDEEKK